MKIARQRSGERIGNSTIVDAVSSEIRRAERFLPRFRGTFAAGMLLIAFSLLEGRSFAQEDAPLVSPGAKGIPELGPVPVPPTDVSALPKGPQAKSVTGSFTVNTASREEVRSFYKAVYRSSDGVPMGSTAIVSSCVPGTNASAYQDGVLRRINWYRAMAGLPAGVTFNSTYCAKDQQAALMMSANNNLSHTPPNSWSCWTSDGTNGAANSNIALGSTGPDAITDYIDDAMSNNFFVGHRRWLLYPQTQVMGTGNIPEQGANYSANATWVFDGNYGGPRPSTVQPFVSWPPPGYVPYQVVFPRWSFAYPNANFTNGANSTTVTMQSNGVPIAVRLETYGNSAGESTLAWVPGGLDANDYSVKFPFSGTDTIYTVTISNVFTNGFRSNFTYSVTIFDPTVPGPDYHPLTITGTDQPAAGQSNSYTCAAVTNATAYQWRQTQRLPFNWMDGAENGMTNFTANMSPGYQAVQSDIKASGLYAFHLAHPNANGQGYPPDQILTLDRLLLPGPNCALQFKSRLGWATTNQFAKVQASIDDGVTWLDLYSQAGTFDAGELVFVTRAISLASLAGQTVRLRFDYAFVSGLFFNQTDPTVGWYLDDLVITNAEELVGPVINTTTANNFSFNPAQIGNYALEVRPIFFGEFPGDWGPVRTLTAIYDIPFHVVTVSTLPVNLANLVGSGTYSNGIPTTFSAPPLVTKGSNDYTFKQWTAGGNTLSTNSSFTTVFSKTDPTNLSFVAEYDLLNMHPLVVGTRASLSAPVPATSNFVVTIQFDRTMQTSPEPLLVFTNLAALVQPTVPPGGIWLTTAYTNDTYRTPPITFIPAMDGTNVLFASRAEDAGGVALAMTNIMSVLVDATPPSISGVAAFPAPFSSVITWSTDEPSTSLVRYGPTTNYGVNTVLDAGMVLSHSIRLSGLVPGTIYHFRAVSQDLAGNEATSSDLLCTPTPGVALLLTNNLPVSGLSGAQGSETVFQISVPTNRSQLIIRLSGGGMDGRLYVKYGSQPAITNYDYTPSSYQFDGRTYVQSVTVANPAAGNWFIMVYGVTNYSGLTLQAAYAYPDLAFHLMGCTLDQVPSAPGDSLSLTLTVTNLGAEASRPCMMSFYFMTDATNYSDAVRIGTNTLPAVNAGASLSGLKFTNTLPMTTLAGSYMLVIWIDQDGATGDNNINNNRVGWFPIAISGPSVQVTSPTPGQRLSNAICTVVGTAPTNKLVTKVLYQLNGGSWSEATGTTNWSATVILVPGTNVFQVEAEDAAGNHGAMTNVSVMYVLSDRLTLLINPPAGGSVSGVANGQMLEIGRGYNATATANAAQLWVFTNWTGGFQGGPLMVLANTPTIQFVMQSNLILQANFFIDRTRLDVALDTSGLAWTTGGNAPWFAQTLTTHDGVNAAQSGMITDGQESWMQTSLVGPGTLSFWWKVSSESDYDYLECYLDDVLQSGSISGIVDWQQMTSRIPSGLHAVKWRYMKDPECCAGGQDAGWVDEVSFLPDHPAPQITTQPVSRTNAAGTSATFTATAMGAEPLAYQWWFNGLTMTNGGAISGVATTDLTIAMVQTNHAGLYSIVVTNAYGSVTSSVAVLTVVSAPSLTIVNTAGGVPQIHLSGPAGTYCDINKSTNLVNWTSIGRVLVGTVLDLNQLDPTWRSSSHGFFRVAVPSNDKAPIPAGRFTNGDSQP